MNITYTCGHVIFRTDLDENGQPPSQCVHCERDESRNTCTNERIRYAQTLGLPDLSAGKKIANAKIRHFEAVKTRHHFLLAFEEMRHTYSDYSEAWSKVFAQLATKKSIVYWEKFQNLSPAHVLCNVLGTTGTCVADILKSAENDLRTRQKIRDIAPLENFEIPDLVGSPRQIAWALDIRMKRIPKLLKFTSKPGQEQEFYKVLKTVLGNSKATYWINSRDKCSRTLVRESRIELGLGETTGLYTMMHEPEYEL